MDGITHDHSTPQPLTARGQRESLSRRMLGTIALTFYIYVRPVHHPGHPEIRRKPNCHTVVPGMQGFPPCLLENKHSAWATLDNAKQLSEAQGLFTEVCAPPKLCACSVHTHGSPDSGKNLWFHKADAPDFALLSLHTL